MKMMERVAIAHRFSQELVLSLVTISLVSPILSARHLIEPLSCDTLHSLLIFRFIEGPRHFSSQMWSLELLAATPPLRFLASQPTGSFRCFGLFYLRTAKDSTCGKAQFVPIYSPLRIMRRFTLSQPLLIFKSGSSSRVLCTMLPASLEAPYPVPVFQALSFVINPSILVYK